MIKKNTYFCLSEILLGMEVIKMSNNFTIRYSGYYSDNDADNLDDCSYDDSDPFYDDSDPFYDEMMERKEEKAIFSAIPKHGVYAHAYRKDLDNLKIKKLWEKNYSYRAIGKQLGCSPNTVRNRLSKLGLVN